MALQTSNLMMVGLGTVSDAPPNSEQPPLVDSIHLRWGFNRELGFPWHGFYLFRRLHQPGTLSWLSQHISNLSKGTLPSSRLQTPLGLISSDTNLVLTEDFPPPNIVEFDLAGRSHLRMTFPAHNPARHVEARIGFRSRPGDPSPTRNTVSFTGRQTGRGPNPRNESGVVFETRDRNDRPRPNTFIRAVDTSTGPITGLGCKFKLIITLPQPATFVEVTLTGASRRDAPDGTPTVETFNQDGTRSDSASMNDPGSHEPETFVLAGTAITRVVIDEQHPGNEREDDQDRVLLNEISFGNASVSDVRMTAFGATTPVRTINLRGYAGRILSAAIDFDGISAVEFKSASATVALVDLGIVPLERDSTTGWSRVPEFQYPMRLPLTHPDYPCTPQTSEDFAASKAFAAARIKYGDPARFTGAPVLITNAGTISVTNGSAVVTGNGTNWNNSLLAAVLQITGDNTVYTIIGVDSSTQLVLSRNYSGVSQNAATYSISQDNYGQFYNYLVSLVAGGSAAGSMAGRTISLPPPVGETGAAHMPNQSPLDMVLLGSLHPAVAQMSGLYWADRAADPAQTYDYLVVGDYNGVAQLNVDNMLGHLQQNGFSAVEASVVHSLRLSRAPALAKPDNLNLYALPGSSRSTETGVEEAVNNVGLRWNLSKTENGVLLPGSPVMYHIWRATLGNGTTPNASPRYDLLTRGWPILVVENGAVPQTAPDWPPFMLHALDNSLAEGWYGYQVSGVDIFGRHTPNSAAGAWRQWAPVPDPRPWYYKEPPGDAVIHASAIRLLTKIAPPSPTGVEAYALDPRDPAVVQDAAYMQWWSNLNTSSWYQALSEQQKKNLIGLRVRWLWPQSHMLQAPHTREFRVYYQSGHLNALLGNTKAVSAAGTVESDVTTDIPNRAAANKYVGATLYAGEDAFVIVGSQEETPLRVRVRNVGPERDIRPSANMPCTIATPAVYSAGAVSVTNGSAVVAGSGTRWASTLAGMLFQIATDTQSYRVAGVDSETQLVLDQPYSGATKSDRVYGIRHPLFVDYSLPTSWQRRFYVVDVDKHWTAETDPAGQPVRRYEIFLPVPEETIHDGVPLTSSLAEPIVYAHVGVSAADDKPHTVDDSKWTVPWAGRIGNEGRVGAPAKIFRVLRDVPPVPALPPFPERQFATRADSHGASYYSYRWQPLERTATQVFRALDNAIFDLDWSQRPRTPLDTTQTALFPNEANDSRWNAAKRQQVATELDQLNTFAHDEAGTAQAVAYYRALSPDALRVLAGLPNNDAAFAPVTTAPLNPDDPATANRRGPDDPDNFQIGGSNPLSAASLRVFIDTLDGLTTNRYFYRAAYVDAAQNRSPLSLATPPVQAPNVVPPRAPVFTKAIAGNRQIALSWASNREADLDAYKVYRTAEQESAIDIRLMTLVHTQPAGAGPSESRAVEVTWLDTQTPPLVTFYYRLVATDSDGNASEPSAVMAARSFQNIPPAPPAWVTVEWRKEDNKAVVFLRWTSPDPKLVCLLQRKAIADLSWSTISSPLTAADNGNWTFIDRTAVAGITYEYRIRATDEAGNINTTFQVFRLSVSLL